MNELLEAHPDFAPAHRTLAEIYGAEAFRDAQRERSERQKYLAACPEGTFTRRPPSVPSVTPRLEQAEQVSRKLNELQQLMAESQDKDPAQRILRTARIEDLRKMIAGPGR